MIQINFKKKFLIQCGIILFLLLVVILMVNTRNDYKQLKIEETVEIEGILRNENLVQQQNDNKDRAKKLAAESLERLKHKKATKNVNDKALENIRSLVNCRDRDFSPKILQHGEYWLLKNFIRASHGSLMCHETITYTTHADFTFMENIILLLERWEAPLSIALYAPGSDFDATIASILYLRNCHPQGNLVVQYATFHVFFENVYLPTKFPNVTKLLEDPYSCPDTEPYVVDTFDRKSTFKTMKKLPYPVNVARNLARSAALTHFFIASDVELYPSPNLVEDFFKMIQKNSTLVKNSNNIFVLPIFEVEETSPVPINKTELQSMFKQNQVIWFHHQICESCHSVPNASKWIEQLETAEMEITATSKRTGSFQHWEPIYIGTHADPQYDERLNWEGKSDKMTQGYILCLLDYNFHILNNAFLVHRPGIKTISKAARPDFEKKTRTVIEKYIQPEIHLFYGQKEECKLN